MFMTALDVDWVWTCRRALVDVAPASTYALHTAAFLLAAPAAFAGVAFFVAVAGFASATAIPRWTRGLPWGYVANAGAVLGVLTLTGPLNSGDGVVGGIAAPLGMYLVWIFAISVWWLRPCGRSPCQKRADRCAVRSG